MSESVSEENIGNGHPLPKAPTFTEEEIQSCRESGDYIPILFEWYKFVGEIVVIVAHIHSDSLALRRIPSQQYHILSGLLNRCARLMLANVALSHEGKFGETTAIVDRCILESAIKISWLCENSSPEKFIRYLADGLRTELEFRSKILSNIDDRGPKELPIESRMLKSIENHISAAQITEQDIKSTKRLPNLATMIQELGYNRLFYIIVQRMGSHHVHGTWPSLLLHYLNKIAEPHTFVPSAQYCETHINQFMFIPKIMLDTLHSYIHYVLDECEDRKIFHDLFSATQKSILEIYAEAMGTDDLVNN